MLLCGYNSIQLKKPIRHEKTDVYRETVRGIRGVSPGEEKVKVGYGGKDLRKRKVLSLKCKSEGVMDDESGESMELMEEMPLKELGEAELERFVRC